MKEYWKVIWWSLPYNIVAAIILTLLEFWFDLGPHTFTPVAIVIGLGLGYIYTKRQNND